MTSPVLPEALPSLDGLLTRVERDYHDQDHAPDPTLVGCPAIGTVRTFVLPDPVDNRHLIRFGTALVHSCGAARPSRLPHPANDPHGQHSGLWRVARVPVLLSAAPWLTTDWGTGGRMDAALFTGLPAVLDAAILAHQVGNSSSLPGAVAATVMEYVTRIDPDMGAGVETVLALTAPELAAEAAALRRSA